MTQNHHASQAYRREVAEPPAPPGADLNWLPDELRNLLYLAERSGLRSTARDLRFAVRSAEVELRQTAGLPPLD
ncbi:hypothetical protein [Dinoroseobacter sp. S375]|uniref:hypothetical protein n=1 Tax=Dinoroseobacter sp. S375 TaxID=3415136 RepID=UPI003C7AB2B1